jgi:hypothetical protein
MPSFEDLICVQLALLWFIHFWKISTFSLPILKQELGSRLVEISLTCLNALKRNVFGKKKGGAGGGKTFLYKLKTTVVVETLENWMSLHSPPSLMS